MAGPPTPSRSSSFASVDISTSQTNAALRGATTAFSRPTTQPGVLKKSYSGTNGALAAATTVGTVNITPSPNRGLTRSPMSIAGSPVKGPATSGPKERASWSNLKLSTSNLAVPQSDIPAPVKSPSQQAAFLAAARAPPPSTPANTTKERPSRPRAKTEYKPRVGPKPRRLSQRFQNAKADDREKPTDTTPISSTSSLVDLFEQRLKATATPKAKVPDPIIVRPSPQLAITSPKPLKPTEGITSVFHMELEDVADETPAKTDARRTTDEIHIPGQFEDALIFDEPHTLESENQRPQSSPISVPRGRSQANANDSTPSKFLTAPGAQLKPPVSPSIPIRSTNAKSNPMPIQPSSQSSTARSESFSNSASSLKTISGQYHQMYPRRMAPTMTGDELANAMVASSLASSRAPSPTRLEPPPVPTRKKKGHHSKLPFSRTPSPAKTGMLQTLRSQASSSSESEDDHHPYGKHRKRRLVRKHPNKHHEGDRKRWRDAVTERERRRYEGVWAANKGLHCAWTPEEEAEADAEQQQQQQLGTSPRTDPTPNPDPGLADLVSNVVARDIWSRSRLPDPVLETVWDLVDTDCVGRLQKEEFVVGLWLIDQRLKGRKLPVKVSESVWASVRRLQGIKIRQK